MRTFKSLLVFIAAVMFLASCSFTAPVTATSNPVGSKVGQASTTQVLGFFFDGGDASIQTAARNGGITEISTVDFKSTAGFLFIFWKYETIVTGE